MTTFLSISDIRARWSCGRTFVYSALAEMERDGYLRKLHLGRVQRVALESVEQYEQRHAAPGPAQDVAAEVVRLRARTARRASPRKAPTPAPGASIVSAWRELRDRSAA